jgi:hypothetical protein
MTISLSANKLKQTLSNKLALRQLGYQDDSPNFKFSKGKAVEYFVAQEALDLQPKKSLREIFNNYSKEEFAKVDLELIKLDITIEDHAKLMDDYKKQLNETLKYESINLELKRVNILEYQVEFLKTYSGQQFRGFIDFIIDGELIQDLKIVDKLPEYPSLGDKIQIFIYEKCMHIPADLVYVSPPSDGAINKYNKDIALWEDFQNGLDPKNIVKNNGTTKQYFEKTIANGLPTKPELEYMYYRLSDDDYEFLEKFVPKLIKKTVNILSKSKPDLIDDLIIDTSGFMFNDSERDFVKKLIMED